MLRGSAGATGRSRRCPWLAALATVVACAASATVAAGCSHTPVPTSLDGGTTATASASAATPPADPPRVEALAPDAAAPPEASAATSDGPLAPSAPQIAPTKHKTLDRLESEPLLRFQLATLRDHFGAGVSGPFGVEQADLPGGHTALLVWRWSGPSRSDAVDPIALAVDRDRLLWTRARPTAGIVPPVEHFTLAARPDGGVALFAWLAALHMVVTRVWADDGNPFGDSQLFDPDACDALSVAYGAGSGWIVACASGSGTRAQRLRDDGTVAWDRAGVLLGVASAAGSATIAFDTRATFILVQQAAAVGGDRLLASRYDTNGRPLWSDPIDLTARALAGHAAPIGSKGASGASRVELSAELVREGVVRVTLGGGRAPVKAVEIASSGAVRAPGR